jgi:hypothetical protein
VSARDGGGVNKPPPLQPAALPRADVLPAVASLRRGSRSAGHRAAA